jgi:hypothetical protein
MSFFIFLSSFGSISQQAMTALIRCAWAVTSLACAVVSALPEAAWTAAM